MILSHPLFRRQVAEHPALFLVFASPNSQAKKSPSGLREWMGFSANG
jgi:hypothetical protein